jgi:hypothetical protein
MVAPLLKVALALSVLLELMLWLDSSHALIAQLVSGHPLTVFLLMLAPLSATRLAEHCDAGSAPQNGACAFCPTGTYAVAGQQSCTHCPPCFWAPFNSVSKDACYPLSAFKVAEHCDAGSAPQNGACAFCPVGPYAINSHVPIVLLVSGLPSTACLLMPVILATTRTFKCLDLCLSEEL